MFLTRLTLDIANRAARRDLGDCHQMHRTVMSGFSNLADGVEHARARLKVLYRVELGRGGAILLVQSSELPNYSGLPGRYLRREPETKDLEPLIGSLGNGQVLRFRLCANPTRKVDTKSGSDGERRNGRRVELRNDEVRLAWLARKGEAGGFALVDVAVRTGVANVRCAPGEVIGRRGEEVVTFGAVTFDGLLRILDAAKLKSAIVDGLGSGKAYGHGLLSVAHAETENAARPALASQVS